MARIKLQDANALPNSMPPYVTTEQLSASTVHPMAYQQSIVSNVSFHPNRLVVKYSYVTSSPNENNSPSFRYAVQPTSYQATSSRISSRRKELARQRLEEEEQLREMRDKEYLERKKAIEENYRRQCALIASKYFDKQNEAKLSTASPTVITHSLDKSPDVMKPKHSVMVFRSPQSGNKFLNQVNIISEC